MLDLRSRGCGFEPHGRHCVVSLSKNINPSLVLVQPRKTCPFISERLLMGCKESNQTILKAYYQNFKRNKLTTCLNNTLLKMHVIVLFYVFTCEKCAGFMFYTFQAFVLLLANIQSIKEFELTIVDCIYNVA